MTKNYRIAAGIVAALAVLLCLTLIGWRMGVVSLKNGLPEVSWARLLNRTPSLDRTTTFPADFPEAGKEIFNTKLAETKAKINEDPKNVAAWFDLAVLYRMVGDQAGAVEIWEYVRANYPEEGISRHNLGEYYFHQKQDYAKAEEYYREAISVAPQLSQNYSDLFEMYAYAYKQDTNAAQEVLDEAIQNVNGPSVIDFVIQGAAYYKGKGNTEQALKYYTWARDAAKEVKNTKLVNQLNAEIKALQ